MKAIQYRSYGPPEVLEYVDLPEPAPQAGEVLVAVEAISVGPGDCKTRAGELHDFHPLVFPKIPGRSAVGTVIGVGSDAPAALLGERVYFATGHAESGCCCERIVRPHGELARVDGRLDALAAAAVAHPAICAWLGLVETARLKAGMSVLIHGAAGAIGAQAVQLAHYLGAQVTATAAHRDLDYVRGLGATLAVAYDTDDFTRLGPRFDVVLDLVGGPVQLRSFDVLAPRGLLIYLIATPVGSVSPEQEARRRLIKVAYSRDTMVEVLALAADGVLKPQPGRVLPLSECAQAHRLIEANQKGRGRLVLCPEKSVSTAGAANSMALSKISGL